MNRLTNFVSLYKRFFWSLEKQARKAGVNMGKHNAVSSHFWSSEPYLISVGSHCQITEGVRFYTHGGAGAVRRKYPSFDTFGKIIIGDYVYIGSGAKILPGCIVGDNVLIAAGSVVTKSIPSNVVVAGNPAKIIGSIDEYIQRNLQYNTNSKYMNYIEKKELLLSLPEEKFIKKDYLKLPSNLGSIEY